MLIGLAIITVGMTVAVPSFQGMIARNTVATEVNEMLLAINLARSEAGRTGSSVSVKAVASAAANEFGGGFCVVPTLANDAETCSANVIRSFSSLDPQATLDLLEAGGRTALVFSARGGLRDFDNVSMDYCFEGQQGRRIVVSPIGRARSYKPYPEPAPGQDPIVPDALQPDC